MTEEEKGLSASVIKTEGASGGMLLAPSNEPVIRNLIYTVRGTQVMLDSDLAMLYGVETKALNQAVRRNINRFPERFRFHLTKEESDSLRSQIVTSNAENGRGGRRYMPYAFTEQGVAMLSAVLRSETAIRVSVQIMDAFVEMRHFIASNAALFEQIRAVELRQLQYQKTTDERFERVFDYMETHEAPKQKVFFDGQIYDAFELLVELVQKAEREIVLIDGYVDVGTLNILAKKAPGVAVIVWTHPRTHLTQGDVDTFNAQYPQLEVRHSTAFHDRFLILDGVEAYLVGASLKDAGKKSFGIARLEDEGAANAILTCLKQ
ncbi:MULTISPECIES: ORF6N domain-containing protein [Gordonibacter]|uniref:ORF6N domain-containing protein n=1 Tax=Gordonibacter faecis TaxID=3047475 RepID=A0ABT7DND8_9ACTN|nr:MULTISPECIES: ORF6N domain-containing protein [unclassified Gordonibacter]MDJ1650073.1 ORF6N domain-containing protein [Gordonibacter sp. KGMB12511]